MPHVSTRYRIYLGAAHHRRPRNLQPWVEPYSSGEQDSIPGSPYAPFASPTIPYTPPSTSPVEAVFVFWSVTDATGGHTQAGLQLSVTVGTDPLNEIAWYYLPGGGGGDGGSAALIDAYSVLHGDFVDDDFVDVTPDSSLTLEAIDEGD